MKFLKTWFTLFMFFAPWFLNELAQETPIHAIGLTVLGG